MRCAVIDTGHANRESASGIHLFFVQESAGADLRRPMINLAYVFGQAVQTGHSETVRDCSNSRAQSERAHHLTWCCGRQEVGLGSKERVKSSFFEPGD